MDFQWKYENKPRDGSCYDCGASYDSYTDIYLQHSVWKLISPGKNNEGYLCPNCIMSRLIKKGINETTIKIYNEKNMDKNTEYKLQVINFYTFDKELTKRQNNNLQFCINDVVRLAVESFCEENEINITNSIRTAVVHKFESEKKK